MNKSAFFLVLLIVPFICTQNVFEMLDKSIEGKEVLNNLFLQTKLMGPNLDVNAIRGVLSWVTDSHKKDAKAAKERFEASTVSCKADEKDLLEVHQDNLERELAAGRVVEAAGRSLKRATGHLERAEEEAKIYVSLHGFVANSLKSWNSFFKSTTESFAKIKVVLAEIEHAGNKPTAAAAISFAEIKSKIDRISTQDLTGLAPIINNLLEISATADHAALKTALNHLKNFVNERLEELEEENEHQKNLFEQLEKSLKQNVERSHEAVKGAKKAIKFVEEKQSGSKSFFDTAKGLTTRSEVILAMRKEECQQNVEFAGYTSIRVAKILEVVGQLEDILLTKFHSMKSYFLQREMAEGH